LAEAERLRGDQEPAVTAMAKKQVLRSIAHRVEKATQKEEMRNRRGSLKVARMENKTIRSSGCSVVVELR